jgi:hypothetical protein
LFSIFFFFRLENQRNCRNSLPRLTLITLIWKKRCWSLWTWPLRSISSSTTPNKKTKFCPLQISFRAWNTYTNQPPFSFCVSNLLLFLLFRTWWWRTENSSEKECWEKSLQWRWKCVIFSYSTMWFSIHIENSLQRINTMATLSWALRGCETWKTRKVISDWTFFFFFFSFL